MIISTPFLPSAPKELEKGRVLRFYADLLFALTSHFRHLADVLNGLVEVHNLASYSFSTDDSGAAGTEITITHGLGRVPTHYIWNIVKDGVVYDSRRDEWTDTVMYVKCTADNAKLNILVLR